MAVRPAIMARLGCASVVLGRSQGKAEQALASHLQSGAMLLEMKQHSKALLAMLPDARATMATLATYEAWSEGHLAKILERIAPPQPKEKKT